MKHGATNLAYLEGCLKGKPKQAKVIVPAQDFGQRDYSDVNEQMMSNLAKEIAEFRKEVG